MLLLSVSCRKTSLREGSDTKLDFSTDTLMFDTVFTQIGTATERFMVRNPYNENVIISSVTLKERDNSKFRFNINGYEGDEVKDLEIEAGDSVFIFVEVTLDPSNQSLPLVIEDAVEFVTNGNLQEVTLTAWGQDAYYYVPTRQPAGFPAFTSVAERYNLTVPGEYTLPNDKPHVIFGYLMIDTLMTLNIEPGTEFYFYANSGLWAYRGSSLKVHGEKDNEVYFRGFRKESFYNTLPGQWDRIILNESDKDHEIDYAVIENSFIGISAEYFFLGGNPRISDNKLKISNTIIQNQQGIGILSRFYNIEATNCLVSNAESRLMGIQGGGNLTFTQCTFGNYWRFGNRQDPSLFISNSFEFNSRNYTEPLNLEFHNSIVYGSNDDEIEADTSQINGSVYNVLFNHSVVKTDETFEIHPSWFVNCEVNPAGSDGFPNPLFKSTEHKRDNREAFYLHQSSAAKDVGEPSAPLLPPTDLKGDSRDGNPDAGAYEY